MAGRLTPDVTRVRLPKPVLLAVATSTHNTRGSTMAQSRTLFIGMDVHKETMAVASVAPDDGAEGTSLGPMGTRQGASEHLVRQMQAKATHLLFGYAADPCGSGLSRYLTKKDDDCWVVAPSLMPKKAGDRVKTNRRDAVPRARLARAGDRTAVSVPMGEEAAMRDLTRAREETLSDCQDAQLRLQAFCSTTLSAPPAKPLVARPLSGGAQRASALLRRRPSCSTHLSGRSLNTPSASSVSTRTATRPSQLGVCPRWSKPCRRSVACHARWPSPWSPHWAT
jgi:transposase